MKFKIPYLTRLLEIKEEQMILEETKINLLLVIAENLDEKDTYSRKMVNKIFKELNENKIKWKHKQN